MSVRVLIMVVVAVALVTGSVLLTKRFAPSDSRAPSVEVDMGELGADLAAPEGEMLRLEDANALIESAPDVALIVNGKSIGSARYKRRLKGGIARYGAQVFPKALFERDKEKAIDDLIVEELLYTKALDFGADFDPKLIDQTIDGNRRQFPSQEAFDAALEAAGFTLDELKMEIERNLRISAYIEKEFVEKADVSEKEARDYYDRGAPEFKEEESVSASHILIRSAPTDSESARKEAREKIDSIREQAVKGADFAALAREHSEDPSSAARGGALGKFGRGRMVKPFEEAAFSSAPGAISDVVETRFGYHIIKVDKKFPARSLPYEQVRMKAIDKLKRDRARENLKAFIDREKSALKVDRKI